MAFTPPKFSCLCILTISLFLSGNHRQATAGSSTNFTQHLSSTHRQNHKFKLVEMTFYFHDLLGGPNVTSMNITSPRTQSGFGQVNVIDNPLTKGPNLKSKLVGRAQGLYAVASLDPKSLALLMVMNFYFTTGEYNGSTITILGRNAVFDEAREMPVIGGSRLFRFARGYAEAETISLSYTVAVVKYNLHVMY